MEKIGTKIKISLVNEHGIQEAISNDFGNETYLKMALYNCPKNATNVKNVLNNYDKFNQKWHIKYEDDDLMIFESKDCWGNLGYFHLKFE